MIEKEILRELRSIFRKKMFECHPQEGDTLMCSINDAFSEFHENGHNCLGCNLQDHVDLIQSFLQSAGRYKEKDHFFTVYCLLLYLLTERILEIIKIIGLPEGYKEKEFNVFKEIKIWANFLKHPKAFVLTHHPRYLWDSEESGLQARVKMIDFNYVHKFYSGEDKNKYKQLVSELRNNKNVIVILPDPVRMTTEFCDACKVFIDIIKENKAYKEILNNLTTLKNYFENPDE